MANQKISQLTEKTVLDWLEEIPFAEDWENWKMTVDTIKKTVLPIEETDSWKFLTNNWETASRETVDALPSQTWQAWKVLTTDWTEASWQTPTWWISTLPWSPIDLKYKWNWSKAQFEALETYRADTEYNVIG